METTRPTMPELAGMQNPLSSAARRPTATTARMEPSASRRKTAALSRERRALALMAILRSTTSGSRLSEISRPASARAEASSALRRASS